MIVKIALAFIGFLAGSFVGTLFGGVGIPIGAVVGIILGVKFGGYLEGHSNPSLSNGDEMKVYAMIRNEFKEGGLHCGNCKYQNTKSCTSKTNPKHLQNPCVFHSDGGKVTG